mmetsp:Transcript_4367/g.11126  ORF Transcript_4367/g.11126 Transcript_4367/m.11126 type:complete len:328 (-) Transcript_4367:81-1064(-)
MATRNAAAPRCLQGARRPSPCVLTRRSTALDRPAQRACSLVLPLRWVAQLSGADEREPLALEARRQDACSAGLPHCLHRSERGEGVGKDARDCLLQRPGDAHCAKRREHRRGGIQDWGKRDGVTVGRVARPVDRGGLQHHGVPRIGRVGAKVAGRVESVQLALPVAGGRPAGHGRVDEREALHPIPRRSLYDRGRQAPVGLALCLLSLSAQGGQRRGPVRDDHGGLGVEEVLVLAHVSGVGREPLHCACRLLLAAVRAGAMKLWLVGKVRWRCTSAREADNLLERRRGRHAARHQGVDHLAAHEARASEHHHALDGAHLRRMDGVVR